MSYPTENNLRLESDKKTYIEFFGVCIQVDVLLDCCLVPQFFSWLQHIYLCLYTLKKIIGLQS
jgi:hypothetical protein